MREPLPETLEAGGVFPFQGHLVLTLHFSTFQDWYRFCLNCFVEVISETFSDIEPW